MEKQLKLALYEVPCGAKQPVAGLLRLLIPKDVICNKKCFPVPIPIREE
jgi:hypothetical protein